MNQKRVRRLMWLMPIYQKRETSKPGKRHKTYPYLLGGLRVDRHRSRLVAWRISNSLEIKFCVKAMNKVIHRFGAPEILIRTKAASPRPPLDRPVEVGRRPDLV